MANTTISPNMGMPVPTVGEDPGPDWASNLNASLSIVDSHNHSAGQGVQITPDGIDINADLPLNQNNLITARSVRFYAQSSTLSEPTDLGCLYESGVDLYYIDGNGNNVRITQSGSVTGATGTITGLPSGTASASFAANTFTFQSATNTPAAMNFGPVTLGQAVASGKSVTISCSGSQPSNYNLTLPLSLPATTQSTIVSDTSGNLSFSQFVASTYTPVLSNILNVSSSSASPSYYTRIGNIVTVFGTISVTPTASGGATTTLTITIPVGISGSFSNANNATGHGISQNNTNIAAFIVATASGTTVTYSFSAGSTSAATHHYSFSYQVI